jgi:hypothetical protein
MNTPFPGMDPYLEHPVLWEAVHTRMIVALANQIQPRLDPRYITSVEERVFIEGHQRKYPDIWVQKRNDAAAGGTLVAEPEVDSGVLLQVDDIEVHQHRIDILDAYQELKLVAVIELVSPSNKVAGPGRDSYVAKQQEVLEKDAHLIEIDLHRRGSHVLSVPEWKAAELQPYDYLACVSRWPNRNQYRVYSRQLRQRLPKILIPLVDPDAPVAMDVQQALEQVYVDGRYMVRVRYHEPCIPPLIAEDQSWADECWRNYRQAHAEWFPENGKQSP